MKRIMSPGTLLQAGPPSPVVMASCIDSMGKPNIITLGMYMTISSEPPLICIGVSPRRYSHDLIVKSGEFVVNVPSISLEKEMIYCGENSGRHVDKFAETGLSPMNSVEVRTPSIRECYGSLECRVVQSHVCGDHTLFVGEVVSSRLEEDVLTEGGLDLLKAKPIIQKNHIYFTVKKRM